MNSSWLDICIIYIERRMLRQSNTFYNMDIAGIPIIFLRIGFILLTILFVSFFILIFCGVYEWIHSDKWGFVNMEDHPKYNKFSNVIKLLFCGSLALLVILLFVCAIYGLGCMFYEGFKILF